MELEEKLKKMRLAGNLTARILDEVRDFVKIGITANDINNFCHEKIIQYGAIPAALNYRGFPKAVCISINEVVCHGISNNRILKSGDIVSIDSAIILDGFYGDSCITCAVGKIPLRTQKLIDIAYESMWSTIYLIKPGVFTGDLGYNMELTAKKFGFNVVKEFAGHGVGEKFHEPPEIAFFGQKNTGTILTEGMFITIEPMLVDGEAKILIDPIDKWTASIKNGYYSAQFEHTIYISNTGFEVLTYNNYDLLQKKIKINI